MRDKVLYREQDGRYVHAASECPMLLNSVVDIPIQALRCHWLQSSQATQLVLHALEQTARGNFGRLGPEFDSIPCLRSRLLLVDDRSYPWMVPGACLKQSFLRMDKWGITTSVTVFIPKSLAIGWCFCMTCFIDWVSDS